MTTYHAECKRGRSKYATPLQYDNHEAAGLALFAAMPNAKECTAMRGAGFDIRWLDRMITIRNAALRSGIVSLPAALHAEAAAYIAGTNRAIGEA